MSVCYRVDHETRYVYASTVSTSQHVAHLRPRALRRQQVLQAELEVEPRPVESSRRTDYFGNTVDQFTVLKPHKELAVHAHSVVQVQAADTRLEPSSSPPWERVRNALRYARGAAADEGAQFAYESPYVVLDPALVEFSRTSFTPGRPLLAAALDLMHRIHAEFRYDPAATTITTPVSRVLTERRGVCQDFAHLQISCLRSLGLPARYVSGYLLTDPPPGRPRLVGADASHAWLSVHCPRHGWVDLDPTNDVVPEQRHVTLAWGRDYGDVSPLHGVILGGSRHTLRVGVSVRALEGSEREEALATAAAGTANGPRIA
jgi:transglutaminase-like putative cysteine protease